MTASETLTFKREAVKKSLSKIVLPKDAETRICWAIGATFNVSGQTIKNYLLGNIGDYFLAEAIYKEFKSLKYTK